MVGEAGQWVDIPQQPVMATPARPTGVSGLAIADLASNGTVVAIVLILFGAVAAVVFLGAVKDAACSCKGK